MYLGDNLLNKGIVPFVEQFVRERAGRADSADAGARPADVRRRRAERRQGRAAGREAEGAGQQPRARRRLHVRPGDLHVGQADQAELPQRARDHRRDSGSDRSRAHGHAAPRRRLVEGHRQARGHARSEPADPRDVRAAHRRHGRRGVARRRQGRHRSRRRHRAFGDSRAGDHRRRARICTPMSARSPRS